MSTAVNARTWPTYGTFDRTILPEYGLPRQLSSDELADVERERGRHGLDRIRVTPRDYAQVVQQLALDERELTGVAGQKVLSCGEGASNFAQRLEQRGAFCVAFDRLYLTPLELMAQKHLIADTFGQYVITLMTPSEALARLPKVRVGGDLTALPFADKSFDKVFVPHVLYWYLDAEYAGEVGKPAELARQGQKMLDECVRVTADGGYVHFNMASAKSCAKLVRELHERWPDVDVFRQTDWVIRLRRRPSAIAAG